LAAGESSEAIDREAFVSGQISDLQARLNVMNLVAGNGEQQLAALARFGRLFEQLGLPSHELGALQRAGAGPAGGGRHARRRRRRAAAARALRPAGLAGPGPRTLALLRPYVTVLPLAGSQATPVNLNTASAEVIYAAVPELDRAQAERLVALRTQNRLTTRARPPPSWAWAS
jgi:general secretion pathway protein K